MKTAIISALVLSAGSSLIFAASPSPDAKPVQQVAVTYAHPENYTDFKTDDLNEERDREYLSEQFTKHLQREAKRYLTAGEHLEITFTNIDLAGEFEPWRGVRWHDVRIMKDIYSPRATLSFRLTDASGKVIAEGERDLRSLAYLMSSSFPNSDELRYDKDMLSDWMRSEFRRKEHS